MTTATFVLMLLICTPTPDHQADCYVKQHLVLEEYDSCMRWGAALVHGSRRAPGIMRNINPGSSDATVILDYWCERIEQ